MRILSIKNSTVVSCKSKYYLMPFRILWRTNENISLYKYYFVQMRILSHANPNIMSCKSEYYVV